jgi:hypothetical protein
VLLVAQLRPYLVVGELPPLPEGTSVRDFVPEGLFVKVKGICVNREKFPVTPLKIDSILLLVFDKSL